MNMDARTIETQLRNANAENGIRSDYISMQNIQRVFGLHRNTISRRLKSVGRIGNTCSVRYYIPHVAREFAK